MMMNQHPSIHTSGQLAKGGIFFLGAISIALSLSLVMALFVPFPLALATVLYGRVKGILLGVVCSFIVFILGWKVLYGPFIIWPYLLAWIFSIFLAEIVLKKKDPLKGFLFSGWILVALLGGLLAIRFTTLEGGIQHYIVKNAEILATEIKKDESKLVELKGEEGREILEILNNPKALAKEVMDFIPKVFFISIFFLLWVNLLLLLKAGHIYRGSQNYPFTEKDLLKFKMPEYMVWPVIACLMVILFGETYLSAAIMSMASTFLYGAGLFYFFHGFGIYSDFLDALKIFGFFRSLLVIFIVVSGYWILALLGLFDLWVNFRKFFKKKDI